MASAGPRERSAIRPFRHVRLTRHVMDVKGSAVSPARGQGFPTDFDGRYAGESRGWIGCAEGRGSGGTMAIDGGDDADALLAGYSVTIANTRCSGAIKTHSAT